MVLPLDIASGQGQEANATRVLPDTVQRGETFEVTINFTAPADEFNTIGLRDTAPDGWNATVDVAWCTPNADAVDAVGARASLTWSPEGGYPNGTNFTAMHKVTVPCNASLGSHSFNLSEYENFCSYCIGVEPRIRENITGNCEVEVIAPAILTSPTSISFYAAFGKGNPQDQPLELWSSTPCMLNWDSSNVTYDPNGNMSWLSQNITSGSCTDVPVPVVLSVNISGMDIGNYTANITIEAPEARNSGQIIPVELYIRETGTLQGKVNFTGRGDAPNNRWIEPFVVKLFQPGDLSQPVWTGVATTNDTGVFTIPEVVVGIYDIGIKNCTCLSEVETNVTVNSGAPTVVDFGTTREGDSDGNDAITIMDFSMLAACFGTSPAGNPNCDFDRNDAITILDFSLLAGNFGESGDLQGY